MNRITLAVAFAAGLGSGGAVTYVANDDGHLTFVEPPPSADVLSAESAALYTPMTDRHVTMVHIIPRGVQGVDADGGPAVTEDGGAIYAPRTHAAYSVPSVDGVLLPVADEHWSNTRSETVPGIAALAEQVIFPAALVQCPWLATPHYDGPLTLAHTDYLGTEVRGGSVHAVARIISRPRVAGLPAEPCNVDVPDPPAEAVAAVAAMSAGYLVPAIKAERGLR